MNIEDFRDIHLFKEGERLPQLSFIAPLIKKTGLNLEFGVYSGETINSIARDRKDLTFHGFDSFTGLPEDWDLGGKFISKNKFDRKGNLPEVESNVFLHKGWFEDTIPSFLKDNPGNISYLHIDSDIYSSAKTIFECLNDRIVEGTIIVFDELCCWRSQFNETHDKQYAFYTTWQEHEWKAFNEWLETYNRKVDPISRSWFQQAAVVVVK